MKNLLYLCIAFLLSSNMCKAQYSTNAEVAEELSGLIDSEAALSVRYFYYPNLQAYYDRQTSTYLYSRGSEWYEAEALPSNLRGYSLSNGKRVAITDYTGEKPYEMLKTHIEQFPANYSGKRQPKDAKEKQTSKSLVSN